MEQVIINPMWLYWLDVLESIKGVGLLLMFVSFFIIAFYIFAVGATFEEYRDEDEEKKFKILVNRTKLAVCIWVSALFISVFVPSKDTVIAMFIAKNVTVEKAVQGKEVVKESVDYIFEKIKEVNNETKN